ncbi:MCP four helix bundle domain-containing protein, partial [Palleronia sp.]|uniref:MCP four helix bundle domain-containing protein n=1 Tax=Palleronia sp. TaxID=1940284 RepID=UPI0035C85F6C
MLRHVERSACHKRSQRMERLSNLKIGTRIAAGFGCLLVLMALLALTAILEVNGISKKLSEINDVNAVKQRYAINLRGSVHDSAVAVRDIVLLESGPERERALDHLQELTATYAANERELAGMLSDGSGSTEVEDQILQKIQAVRAATGPLAEQVVATRMNGDVDRAKDLLLSQARSGYAAWLAAINEFIDHQETLSQDLGKEARRSAGGFDLVAVGALAIALLLASLVAMVTVRSITQPMKSLQDLLKRMARGEDARDGNISCRKDELGDLARVVADVRESVLRTEKQAAAARAALQEEQLRQAEVAAA